MHAYMSVSIFIRHVKCPCLTYHLNKKDFGAIQIFSSSLIIVIISLVVSSLVVVSKNPLIIICGLDDYKSLLPGAAMSIDNTRFLPNTIFLTQWAHLSYCACSLVNLSNACFYTFQTNKCEN